MSNRVESRRIVSNQVESCRIMSNHVESHRITLNHVRTGPDDGSHAPRTERTRVPGRRRRDRLDRGGPPHVRPSRGGRPASRRGDPRLREDVHSTVEAPPGHVHAARPAAQLLQDLQEVGRVGSQSCHMHSQQGDVVIVIILFAFIFLLKFFFLIFLLLLSLEFPFFFLVLFLRKIVSIKYVFLFLASSSCLNFNGGDCWTRYYYRDFV